MAVLLRRWTAMRRLLRLLCIVPLGLVIGIFAGPVLSGAVFWPLTLGPAPSLAIPPDYTPLHKGSVDLASGLYTRENEDLFVPGNPGLVLRRTYLSGYRVSKEFGIGTTHNGEMFLIGDGERFQWVSLILPKGTRIHFTRTSAGAGISNAVFEHRETTTEWAGAQVGWSGFFWTLRRPDGYVLMFRACGKGTTCSIIQERGADLKAIYYRRDLTGRLLKMDNGAGAWIAFDYDDHGRIARAHSSLQREVRYTYDAAGRLIKASTTNGPVSEYGYTDLDELATIKEPNASIENAYKDGHAVRQTNYYDDGEPLIFDFDYIVRDAHIVRTISKRSDGMLQEYEWDASRRAIRERHERDGYPPLVMSLERQPENGAIRRITLSCPNNADGAKEISGEVTAEKSADDVKRELVRRCFG